VTDPQVLSFWKDEYPKMNYKNAFDGVAPIANKLGAFLSHPTVRKALCNPVKSIRLRSVMDKGQALVVNLSQGKLGSDVSDVLGGLILSLSSQAAFTRHGLPDNKRRQFTIYADEFHRFTTKTLAGMLAELRKFKVGLVLAGQHTGQIEKLVYDAIFGNIGTFVIFRVGANDAPTLARQLEIKNSADLIGLPNFRFYMRLMIEGMQTHAFTAHSLPDHPTGFNPSYARTSSQ
jgi:type IV secretory pathway TraG/TraD family ATPase VirD4